MSNEESTKASAPAGKADRRQSEINENLLIEQVRNELESYFSPANIQKDFHLRQKMTSDGYIDISLLLDFPLLQNLIPNKDVLLQAIKRSKQLVMNSGCTMVKYMALLERNVLILRDIATSTETEQIMAIFASDACAKPSEVHSDIGNNWFCQFKSEDECLSTAKYLQQSGSFKGKKLHVRVKAIHDMKSDTSPQMATSAPIKQNLKRATMPTQPAMPPPPQIAAYPPGYYQGAQYTYYGAQTAPLNAAASAVAVAGMDQYFYGTTTPVVVPAPNSGDKGLKHAPMNGTDASKGAKAMTPPLAAVAVEEERTATSDYPGDFDRYTQQEFLAIYTAIKDGAKLKIPQAMRGRDFRIISDETLLPIALKGDEKDEEESGGKRSRNKEQSGAEEEENRGEAVAKKSKKRRKKKNKNRELSGRYYEEDMAYDQQQQYPGYAYDYGYGGYEYYYEDGYGYGGEQRRYYNDASYYEAGYGGSQGRTTNGSGGGRKRSGARKYRSARASQETSGVAGDTANGKSKGGGGGGGGGRKRRGAGGTRWSPVGARKNAGGGGGGGDAGEVKSKKKSQKVYNTSKGVYRPKAAAY